MGPMTMATDDGLLHLRVALEPIPSETPRIRLEAWREGINTLAVVMTWREAEVLAHMVGTMAELAEEKADDEED